MEVSLLHIEGETKVDSFEDSLLSRPENIGRLEVGVNYPVPVEDREGGEEVPGELDCEAGRQPLPLILEYNLRRVRAEKLSSQI